MRRLTPGEQTLAASVFGDAIDLERVRLVPTPFRTAVTTGPMIWMPSDALRDFADAPLHLRGWLVHELTHVWQFATAPVATLASWAKVVASGGYGPGLPGYAYAHPFDWRTLNLEQQARVVEHAFRLREGGRLTHEEGATAGAATPLKVSLDLYVGRTPFEALTRRG